MISEIFLVCKIVKIGNWNSEILVKFQFKVHLRCTVKLRPRRHVSLFVRKRNFFLPFSKKFASTRSAFRSFLQKTTAITVEPRLYGHQGDMRKCPYYRGVRNKRVIFLKKCKSLLFVGTNKTVRNIGVSVLSGVPLYCYLFFHFHHTLLVFFDHCLSCKYRLFIA